MKTKYKIISSIIVIIILFIISIFLVPINLKQTKESTIIYDSNNIEIGEIINNNDIRHRFKEIKDIPNFTKNALILIEDKNFYENNGIDFIAIIRAVKNNFKSLEKIEGASTISTQVIRNNYWLNSKRTYLRKLAEFYLALGLNTKYSKDKILEYYLNNIYYGYLNYGIGSASKYYFNKDINNLTNAEQIALLILPKNPIKYNPYKNLDNFNYRFKKITKYLNKEGLISDNETESILAEKIDLNYNHKNKLPYIVDCLKKNKSINLKNKNIITNIDYNLTKKIEELSKNVIDGLQWKDVGDYGVLITDRKTNELKVMIGGIDYYLENGQVNSTTSLRQVGSTIKPFTYLLSFKDLGYKPKTSVLDLPIQFNTIDGNNYSPKNYSLDYKGEISIAEALSQSINIPAVKTLNKIGLHRLYDFLKELKITSINKEPEYYGLSLTLGVSEISLYELLQAYSIFANDGDLCDIQLLSTENYKHLCKNIIEKKYIDMINEILTNRYFKLKGFPINSNLDFANREIFVKTGTSRNFRDNWTIGYTKNYMIGVWVGNKDGTYMKGVSGATGAGEIFKDIVEYLEPINNNSSNKKITFNNYKNIKFLEIISPLNNSIYKIDKIKPNNISQIKLEFKTNIEFDNYKWYKDNIELKSQFINLSEGMHTLKIELYNEGKKIGEKSSHIEIIK